MALKLGEGLIPLTDTRLDLLKRIGVLTELEFCPLVDIVLFDKDDIVLFVEVELFGESIVIVIGETLVAKGDVCFVAGDIL